MLPGPVFQWELIRIARRPRFFWMRAIYGMILLFLIWQHYLMMSLALDANTGYAAQMMPILGHTMFYLFASVQLLAVIVLTPTAFATTIVEERQRRTLHYLLASPLSSAEIVVGKLMAKLVYLGVFLAVGLPVVSLLSLIGGIEPLQIYLVYGGTFTTAYLLGSAGILISTYARKVREAVVAAGGFAFAWFVLPTIISYVFPILMRLTLQSPVYSWVLEANEWVLATNPFTMVSGLSRGPAVWMPQLAWLIGLQVGYGTSFLLIAVWRLRRVFRGQEGRVATTGRAGRSSRSWRLLRRPECGNDPVLWKEQYTSRATGLARFVTMVLALLALGFLGYATYYFMWPAITQRGLASNYEASMFLRSVITGLYVLGALGIATNVSISIPTEREEDTWASLLSTPLPGWHILRGKMLGLTLRFWPVYALIGVYLLLGLVTGLLHPLSAGAAVVEISVFTWFAVVLGMFCSMRAASSMRAQRAALGSLVILNGIAASIVAGLVSSVCGEAMCTPSIVAVSLAPPRELGEMLGVGVWQDPNLRAHQQALLACMAGTVGYAVLAYVLTIAIRSRFVILADRPRRSRYGATPLFRKPGRKRNDRSGKPEQLAEV